MPVPFSQTAGPSNGAELEDRIRRMVLGADDCPRPSGLGRAVDECTNGFIIELRDAAKRVWSTHQEEIVRACAPGMPHHTIDEMDVLAFCVVDALHALDGQLLHPSEANKFGKRIAKQAARVDVKLKEEDRRAAKALSRAKGKGAGSSEHADAAERTCLTEKATILAKRYDPEVPRVAAGVKRKRDDALPASVAVQRADAAESRAALDVERRQRQLARLGPAPALPPRSAPDHAWRTFARTEAEFREAAGALASAEVVHTQAFSKRVGAASTQSLEEALARDAAEYAERDRARNERWAEMRAIDRRWIVHAPPPALWSTVRSCGATPRHAARPCSRPCSAHTTPTLRPHNAHMKLLSHTSLGRCLGRYAEDYQKYLDLQCAVRVGWSTRSLWGSKRATWVEVDEFWDGLDMNGLPWAMAGELKVAWPMVAGTGIGPPPSLEEPSLPAKQPWCYPTWPPWVKLCKERGIDPLTNPLDPIFDRTR